MSQGLSGAEAERRAERHLIRHGLKTLTRNYTCKAGEIDLVMASRLRTTCLICIEVRYRASQRFGGAVASITAAKQHRIASAAQHLRMHLSDLGLDRYQNLPVRFDVVALDGLPNNLKITWLRGAFGF